MKDKEFETKQTKSKSKIDLLYVREREVALLVAKGYSNIQNADELYKRRNCKTPSFYNI